MQRVILHSDMNSFYASVETMLDPSLRGKAVAVCGNSEERHGIVLAKSEAAKRAGVKTGMVRWEAAGRCPGLITVQPHYEQYLKYSQLARAIYLRYTDLVEPYGMDENYLDVSGSVHLFRDSMELAQDIRNTVKNELGLTVSIGLSFNKVFAKLGSDMKKPDAVTEISQENFKSKIWPLPASDLLFVGRSTSAKLESLGIFTIGALANTDPSILKGTLGVNGLYLWSFANGTDQTRVMHRDFVSPIKSIGRGTTCTADMKNESEVWLVMLELSQDVAAKLRVHGLCACGVQIFARDSALWWKQYQGRLPLPTQNALEIARRAMSLFTDNYSWSTPLRTITVRAVGLMPRSLSGQTSLFYDAARREKTERLDTAIDRIRERFGKHSIAPASLLDNCIMPRTKDVELTMPGTLGR